MPQQQAVWTLERAAACSACRMAYLWAGVHYNSTGMIALCLCMMSLLACSCTKNPLLKAVCVIPAAMSAVVVVLTQSRTSRYALLLALAIGAFDLLRRALAAAVRESRRRRRCSAR